jgi:hypothetical protein
LSKNGSKVDFLLGALVAKVPRDDHEDPVEDGPHRRERVEPHEEGPEVEEKLLPSGETSPQILQFDSVT